MNAPIRTPEELEKRIAKKERRRKLWFDALAAALLVAVTGLALGGSRFAWALGVGFAAVYLAEETWINRWRSLKSRIEVLEERVREFEDQRR